MSNTKNDIEIVKTRYSFHEKLIIRTPSFGFTKKIDLKQINEIINNNYFLAAIYNATPILYNEIEKYKAGQLTSLKDIAKLQKSVYKYYSRMCSRATPFGLFANCGIVHWDHETIIERNEKFDFAPRLDMNYLGQWVSDLLQFDEIKKQLKYSFNNSIYKVGNTWRYIDYFYKDTKRIHQLSSLHNDDIMEFLMQSTNEGMLFDEWVGLIVSQEYEKDEAINFVLELIKEQVLISQFDVNITGDDYLQKLLLGLQPLKIQLAETKLAIEKMEEAFVILAKINNSQNDCLVHFQELEKTIESLPTKFEKSKLIQIDSFAKFKQSKINKQIQQQLLETLDVLQKTQPQYENQELLNFKTSFQKRYEERLLPLLEVLDPNIGIGFGHVNSNENDMYINEPLIAKSATNSNNTNLNWSNYENELLKAYLQSKENNFEPLQLEKIKVENNGNPKLLAPSIAAFFSILPNEQILLENFTGTSSLLLLGRFSCGNIEIENICKEIATKEQATNNDIILAEIIHLPENRTGNILMHKAFRKHEIGFLAKPTENKIALQDLMVGIVNHQIVLIDKTTKKRIIPRLSNAHNYSSMSLPVYNFLCSLQIEGITCYAGFSWSSLSSMFQQFPRVMCNNVVVKEAEWNFGKTIIEEIQKLVFDSEAYHKFFAKHQLPMLINIADSDNELMINFENTFSFDVCKATLKNRIAVTLKENLNIGLDAIATANAQPLANQFVATLFNDSPVYNSIIIPQQQFEKKYQGFDEDWFYLKIYTKPESQTTVLKELIHPLVQELNGNQILQKWFYIKYFDTDSHIRLRILPRNGAQKSKIFEAWQQEYEQYKNNHLIQHVQTDVYKPEFARYGFENRVLAETFFMIDSNWQMKLLQNNAVKSPKWLIGFMCIDSYLNAAHFRLDNKLKFAEENLIGFEKEFAPSKYTKDKLNKKYSDSKATLPKLIVENNATTEDLEKNLTDYFEIIDSDTLRQILPSLIHMCLNRLFIKEQRMQEYFAYDLATKYYKQQFFTQKNTIANNDLKKEIGV